MDVRANGGHKESLELSAEVDLDVAWNQVIEECDKIAGWSTKEKKVLRVTDVINNIKPHKDVPPTTTSKAKKFVKTTLVCIQRFGDVVATASAAVFPASQQCFNAINFVITATQKTSEFFEALTTLMERISVFLETLNIYLEDEAIAANTGRATQAKPTLDPRLRSRVYQVLEHFITIMTLTHEFATRSKRQTVKVFFTSLGFGEDDRIKVALATLETRISDITRVQITVIGQDLQGAARNILELKDVLTAIAANDERHTSLLEGLKSSEDQRRALMVEQEKDELIRLKLNLSNTRPWRDRHIELSHQCVPGTGLWLTKGNTEFRAWSDGEKHTVPAVFSFSAPVSHGKTFISRAVIEHLVRQYPPGGAHHIAQVTYVYLPDVSTKQGNNDKDRSHISQAVNEIIYQFCQGDAAYRDFVASVCEEDVDLATVGELWRKLVVEYANDNEAMFFVVIDGIQTSKGHEEQLLSSIAQGCSKLEDQKSPGCVRVFLTGLPKAVGELQQRCGLPESQISLHAESSIDRGLANEDDVRQFLATRLEGLQNFLHPDPSVNQKHKKRIQDTLLQQVRGDYDRHNLVLLEIEHCLNTKQLDNILDQVKESQGKKIMRQIEILNQTLHPDEIIELNAIIAWLHDGESCEFRESVQHSTQDSASASNAQKLNLFFPKTVMESMFYGDMPPHLNLLDEYLGTTTSSERLGTLKKQISERYGMLLRVDDNDLVMWKYEDLKSLEVKSVESIVDQMARRRRAIFPPDEVALIERMVRTQFTNVFGKDGHELYTRYGLDEFFGYKKDGLNVRLKLEKGANHAHILKACLSAMCDHRATGKKPYLGEYAYAFFRHHLTKADSKHTDKSLVQNIGRYLVNMLREDEYLDLWWSRNSSPPMLGSGTSANFYGLAAIHAWLCHPAVWEMFQLVPIVNDWLRELTKVQVSTIVMDSKSTRRLTELLMGDVAKRSARQWYLGEVDEGWAPFYFVLQYVQKVGGFETRKSGDGDYWLEGTKEVEAWVRANSTLSKADVQLLRLPAGQVLSNVYMDHWYRRDLEITEEWLALKKRYDEAVRERGVSPSGP